jgi:hypothetical protein
MLLMQSSHSYSDGCSWVPDFWFRECCEEHDYGATDEQLFMCIVESGIMEFGLYQGWLLGITLGIIYWVGLKLFGWIYQLYKKRKQDGSNNEL